MTSVDEAVQDVLSTYPEAEPFLDMMTGVQSPEELRDLAAGIAERARRSVADARDRADAEAAAKVAEAEVEKADAIERGDKLGMLDALRRAQNVKKLPRNR